MVSAVAQTIALEDERTQIEEAKAGNLDAMRPIFEHYATPLYSAVIMPRIGDAAAAEDILRDTMATAVQKLHTFEWTGRSIFGWLRQIAVNKTYDVHRKRKRSRRLEDAIEREASLQPEQAPRADHMLIQREEREESKQRIAEVLDKINPRYQKAIRLRLIEELPREQCAAQLEVSVSTFDVVFFRAVRAFRKHYGEPVS